MTDVGQLQITPRLRRLLGVAAIRQAAAQAGAQALEEWRRRHLPRRFRADAFSAYGYSPRSPKYARRQKRRYGGPVPYVSPRPAGHSGGAHMRDLLQQEGGTALQSVVRRGVVTISLTLAAAKVLNFHPGYRSEFLGWGRGRGRLEAVQLQRRALGLLWEDLQQQAGAEP